ncbi:minor tail protein [Streptomyces phage Euratis]|uniref:Minor tail protein n=1 Tax=Streptomyces phage Euratis TaxID=2510569 RepID=A0A411B0X7_9CAUD|nr:minor tail protein [Streptomyces phage Euratis]
MGSFAWFQDGVGYGAADLANWQSLNFPRGQFRHLFANTSQFLANSNQTNRTVTVGAGSVFVGGATSGGTWAYSDGGTLNVPTASNDNPRKDLIVARLTTAAVDGSNGLAIEVVQGTPAASPQLPARPNNAVAIAILDVPKATTTFTLTPCRTTGQFTDQAALVNGHLAIDWAAQLPVASAFPVGFTLYDYGTNQRWIRKNDGTWFTQDFGPWVLVTPVNFQVGTTNITTSGSLYVRESSSYWEFSGRLDFSPSWTPTGIVSSVGSVPSTISRPTQHTYTIVGQSYSAGSKNGGTARMAYTTTGGVELAADPNSALAAIYVNAQLSKSPFNS